ncbi:MAG: Alanyl-tRNA synthetase (EC [uncultured Thiotrichaceae bacterium]|uniref:Alanine--tRNA ligase n=1 Tax=uncultured Thiotrichaceae bacterium TaxID=298394 RepID=A0A6S6UG98_9GAMM|nr:MAG: Alanyl-tRNA synthetase (EC [uncultured Thiotrichaceae bacterium]
MTSSADIRKQFLSFFEEKGHSIEASSSLVPGNDPTLLFTNAGMVQFKDVFLGTEARDFTRATTSQRCVRAGGKHNDLENVGYTARHHTFFEMLGNFSFGDYFKEEAITYAWEFLTEVIGLPKEKLWVTVFEEDAEAEEIWLKKIGVDPDRCSRIGAKDNFWQMGDTGPCGPCTEIFYDHGADIWGGPPGTPEEDGDRYIEIWNLVFMQYDRSSDGTLNPLPKPSVDTGMGLERLAAILQGVHSNYEIDIFQNLIKAAAEQTNTTDLDNKSLRVIADHIRSTAFLIVDGVLPSNEGRGYVLRRIIRRAIRHGYQLDQQQPFFHKLVAQLVAEMGEAYPELTTAQEHVEKVLLKEERRFAETLDQGMKILEASIADLDGDIIPGNVLFKLYDTYGFPVDLTADIARERNLNIDKDGFEIAMNEQRDRARNAGKFAVDYTDKLEVEGETAFTGYDHADGSAVIAQAFVEGAAVTGLENGQQAQVVLDTTPFYAESGGQIGDQGELKSATGTFVVEDTQKQGDVFVHVGTMTEGSVSVGDQVQATIDESRRQAIVLNHSATHLMHAALRDVLGEHVEQKGSLVNEQRLRFDFSHFDAVTSEQLAEVEQIVNQEIRQNATTDAAVMSMDDAKARGAMALFGEKYGNEVRVVNIGFSTELCGGVHVQQAGDIGFFKILSESGIASGVRRIEAVTGQTALDWVDQQTKVIDNVAKITKSNRDNVVDKVTSLVDKNRQLEKEVQQLKGKLASQAGSDMASQAVQVGDIQVLAARLDGDVKTLRDTMDQLKNKLGKAAIVLSATNGEKVTLIAGVTKAETAQIKAGELVNHVAQQVGGKGGGRPDMAQAGGSQPENLDAALASVLDWVKKRI